MQDAQAEWCQGDQADVSKQKLSRCLGGSEDRRQVAISKTHHGVPDITTGLARGKTIARVASSFSLVISLTVAAQPREW